MRSIIRWIDFWDDRINPITVRDCRKLKHLFQLEFPVILVWFFSIILYTLFLIFLPEMIQNTPREQMMMIPSGIPLLLSTVSSLFCGGSYSYQGLAVVRTKDELLNIIPLPPRQQVHGYLATSCIMSLHWGCLFYPLIAIGQLFAPISYVWFLLPLGGFVLGQVLTLLLLSFIARAKQIWEFVLIFIGPFNFGWLPFAMPWFGVFYLLTHVLNWEKILFARGFLFLSLFVLLPASMLIIGYVAYQLSIYGFKTWLKPFWHTLLFNIAIYSLLSVLLAIVWLGLAALWFVIWGA
jgi:hypothetical protein